MRFAKVFMGRRLARMAAAALALGLLTLAAHGLKLFEPLPLDAAKASSRLVLDRNGALLRAFTTSDDRWRLDASPEKVSASYLSLLLAFEDKRFWTHPGVDPRAMARAVLQSAARGRIVSGGSTITMQVARLLRGSPTHSLSAKFQQIADAFRLEAQLSKHEILKLYLKLAPYGGNLEGVRAASLAYFGKEPQRLTLAEAALLVAIPQSPETRKPGRGETALFRARNRVIQRGLATGVVAAADADFARVQPVPTNRRDFASLAPHLAQRLAAVDRSAVDITTTIDRDLQIATEAITRRHVLSLGEKLSVAALVINHRTGEVLAHVGSPGAFDEARLGAIDMTDAVRSPGSALKPFIYGLAFEEGLAHPETLIEDRPVRFDTYAPANFDTTFHGTVSVRQALQLSLNVPAVKVLNEVSPARLSARFKEAGVPFAIPRNLTVALGGTGLTLENLGMLYASLARGGETIPLRFTRTATLSADQSAVSPSRVLSAEASWYIADILRGAPTPSNSAPGQIAFKTGTSYGFRDAWAAGFDGEHTIAVWVGRADSSSVPGLMGLKAAAPIVFDLFQAMGPKRAPFRPAPANIISVQQSSELPPPLRAFRETARSASLQPSTDQALRISYPPHNAEIEVAAGGETDLLAIKAEGGTLPFTWLADGVPLTSSPHRRDAFLLKPRVGFMQLTVIDANGRSDRTQIRLR